MHADVVTLCLRGECESCFVKAHRQMRTPGQLEDNEIRFA